MSVTLSIRFLTGRFHATPWNHQVNEGIVEYPPSPWRILRALVSAYYHLPDRPPRDRLCQLVTTLAETLPSYQLPPHTTAHTRHYMPLRKEGKETTTKVLDTFIVFDRATTLAERAPEIQVMWRDVELDTEQQQLLERLCDNLTYLGRAESWCDVSVSDQSPTACNVQPLGAYKVTADETARVLTPLSPSEFEGFRAALANVPRPKRAKWKIPQDLLDVLEVDIGDLHRQGWSGVPGARWTTYAIARTVSQSDPPTRSASDRPTLARFDLTGKVLPRLTEALHVGERFRQGLMRDSHDNSEAMRTFSGRQPTGEKRDGQHHAWYLPEDSDGNGRIDRVWVFAAEGFSEDAVRVLYHLASVWSGKAFQVQTRLTGLGTLEDYRSTAVQSRSLLGCSRIWRSLTPFVLPRHPKKKIDPETGWRVEGVEFQAKRLLAQLPSVLSTESLADLLVDVRILNNAEVGHNYPWQDFRRRRLAGHGRKSSDRGYWVELEFKEAQFGPIAIGYGAHFGLGLFVPS